MPATIVLGKYYTFSGDYKGDYIKIVSGRSDYRLALFDVQVFSLKTVALRDWNDSDSCPTNATDCNNVSGIHQVGIAKCNIKCFPNYKEVCSGVKCADYRGINTKTRSGKTC